MNRKLELAAIGLAAIGATNAFAAAPESDDPIIIVQNNWTSQLVLSNIVGNVLEEMGYTLKYTPSDAQLQFTAIANGDLHFQIEVREGSMKDAFESAVAEGMVDAGTHDAITREEWWYPAYVREECPGLPDWKALDACADKFATAETAPKGRFVGPPADWGRNYAERIEALKMNFEVINVSQVATLWGELQSAYARKEPIVLFNWTPNYIEAVYEGEFVDFPSPEPACFDDASWGPNPDATGDCGAPHAGWLKKAAWGGLADKYPAAWGVIRKINFNNAQIAEASSLVEVEGMTPEEAAERWMEDNTDLVESWMK